MAWLNMNGRDSEGLVDDVMFGGNMHRPLISSQALKEVQEHHVQKTFVILAD